MSLKESLCPVCETPFDTEDLNVIEEDPKRNTLDHEIPPKKGKDSRGFRPRPKSNQHTGLAWLKKHDAREGEILLSSKMKALRKELVTCPRGHPSDKKIIFVQWIQAAITIGSILENNSVGFVYYTVSPQPIRGQILQALGLIYARAK